MKIKTFNSFLNDAETAINKFIADKTVIDIKMNTVLQGGKVFTHYLVVYEDGGKNEEVPVQMADGITTYTRPKGSDEPFQRVNMSISVPVSSNPKHHYPSWLDDPANRKKLQEYNLGMGRFE